MSRAWLFPGQGAQTVGMGKDLVETDARAREVFEIADRVLGFSLSEICFQGPEEELRRTAVTQPALLAASVAAARVLEAGGHWPEAVAGHNRECGTSGRRALAGERWVLLGPAKAFFTTTEGGCAINQRFEVLDEAGEAIPGLYAVGQNGLGGQILWGHGLHIAWAMTSGRMVGEQLANR